MTETPPKQRQESHCSNKSCTKCERDAEHAAIVKLKSLVLRCHICNAPFEISPNTVSHSMDEVQNASEQQWFETFRLHKYAIWYGVSTLELEEILDKLGTSLQNPLLDEVISRHTFHVSQGKTRVEQRPICLMCNTRNCKCVMKDVVRFSGKCFVCQLPNVHTAAECFSNISKLSKTLM